ncbi:MAG: ABC transporter ATP-binding protein [bacterium]|nr:ABC transporter ATP-binding protein [bacterium]
MSFIELTDVHQAYGHKRVLNDIDLRIREGEFTTIVGPTGCGKSTMLRLILGSEQPVRGSVTIEGTPVTGIHRDRGIVFQQYGLFPNLTVLENIMFGPVHERHSFVGGIIGRAIIKLRRGAECWLGKRVGNLLPKGPLYAIEEQALEYLNRIGLSEADAGKYPFELSGGMRQRVAIASAAIMKPKVFLMDEPFGALDAVTRQKMQQFILELHQKYQMTIFFVTHELREALFLGTRVIALSQYYKTDNGGEPGTQGSKIISDFPLQRTSTLDEKYSPELNAIEKQLMEDLDGSKKKYIGDFHLTHPDSFRTVDAAEWRRTS